jgi:hypothetical protein
MEVCPLVAKRCTWPVKQIRPARSLESHCHRYLDYKGEHAKVVPQWTEDWLIARTRAEDTTHFLHAPSLPFAYSSGKLGDWYPDLLDTQSGHLVMYKEKPGWQRGWYAQH